MDFKSLLAQLDQLNEATEKSKTGLKHTAEPGGYGRKDDEDEEGNKVKVSLFGSFDVKDKKARIGRNPKTKEEKEISSRRVVTFKPSKFLSKKINK